MKVECRKKEKEMAASEDAAVYESCGRDEPGQTGRSLVKMAGNVWAVAGSTQGPLVGRMVLFQLRTLWPQRLKPGPRVDCVRYDWKSYPSLFWRRMPCRSVVPPGLGSLFSFVPRTEVLG